VEQVQPLQYGLVGILGLLFLLQIIGLLGSRKKEKKVVEKAEKTEPPVAEAPASAGPPAGDAQVVQFLGRLQEKGRLVDFAMDDITPYSNEQVGAAARVVHQGCREVLQACFDIAPIYPGAERETIHLAADFDASSYRLIGRVPETPPFKGTVLHRGWKTSRVNLPRLTEKDAATSAREIIAPSEVEVE
jgi:hypothetical protein